MRDPAYGLGHILQLNRGIAAVNAVLFPGISLLLC